MATVTEDLQRGHRLTDINGGSEITRSFRITGLVGAPHAQLLEAVRDPGIPKIGDLYPNETVFFAQVVDCRPDGPNAAFVEVNYSVANRAMGGTWNQPFPAGRDGNDVKSVSFSLREKTTTTDRGGTPMSISPPASKTLSKPYLSEARSFLVNGRLVFERPETQPQPDRMRSLLGHVNSTILGPYAANTLLFAAYESISEDGGRSWQTTYGFDFDPDFWRHNDTWRDESGRIPTDATEATFDVVPTADFSTLGLNFADSQTPL